jgi:formate dehydrogenase subunit gamma
MSRLLRFDGVQRAAHWATAVLFAILMLTALPLYFGGLGVAIGRRVLIEQVHLWSGICLPIPILVSVAGPWGWRMRRDLRRFNGWTRDELSWLRHLGGRRAPPVVDKFNPAQKLNAVFVGAAIVVMLTTGCILEWFAAFPLGWRPGATFVHDAFALAIFVVVAGHIVFALTHPEALRSMLTGRISERWAQRHAPEWLQEAQEERSQV